MSKAYKVKWTSNAKEDLLNIVDYIKKNSLSAARKVYGQIKEKVQSSNFFPLRGRVVPELLKESYYCKNY
ncbi:MAG: type II toxin-antitoxin system RelE/ParE family toxin [Sulfurovum sp.]|nr:type II toxin-antitoxin system RelE/ParE family toxin [Sulfurovum sp.]MCB4762023.1 type II toxin-antitoxin system RelE/ParE family toxin [Sulfurovum sp.]MCB4783811.1 type II toxin-antitoxin system RelE/ParE family toxin [Sulfurovum sp.]